MSPITGYDWLSLDILKALEKGARVKDIPSLFPVSLDQTKRLSRYLHTLQLSKEHLTSMSHEKIQWLGLKSLVLHELYKKHDWQGLDEILSHVTETTTRDELKLSILALEEKRNRVAQFESEVNRKMAILHEREKALQTKEKELQQLKKQVSDAVKEFQKYPTDTHDFLMQHVGLYDHKFCLMKRVDSRWQSSLKKRGIVMYDETEYVHVIPHIDTLAADYERRIKGHYDTVWDEDKEWDRFEKSNGLSPESPSSPYYRKGNRLVSEKLTDQIKKVEVWIKQNQKERTTIQKEIKDLRKTSVKSFYEAVMASQVLSPYDLKRHGEWQDKAAKWLYSQGYVVATEVVLPNGRRVDVIGYNDEEHIVIIEVKASRSDFMEDSKWDSYLAYCDEFFFCFEGIGVSWITYSTEEDNHLHDEYEERVKVGLLHPRGNTLEKVATDTLNHSPQNRKKYPICSIQSCF